MPGGFWVDFLPAPGPEVVMTTPRRYVKVAAAVGAGLVVVALAGASTGRRCIVVEDAPDGELSVAPICIEFSPNGGYTVMPVSAHRGACVFIRTNVTIAGTQYDAGDRLVVNEEGQLIRADWIQTLRMNFGHWTGRITGDKAGGPHVKQASRTLE